ncbi:hypothetical protein ACJ41O_006473 [Fusarium nematophilum]
MPESLLGSLKAIWPSINPDGLGFDADPAKPELLEDLACYDDRSVERLVRDSLDDGSVDGSVCTNTWDEDLSEPELSSPSDTQSTDSELSFDLGSPAESNGMSMVNHPGIYTDRLDSFDPYWIPRYALHEEGMTADEDLAAFSSRLWEGDEDDCVLILAHGHEEATLLQH